MNRKLMVVGLTGGIGTGKSTAADYLKHRGFVHIDADQIGRDITADGSPMLPILNQLFGPDGAYGKKGFEVLRADGSLDRQALASLVFTDGERKKQLDKVMFEAIIAEIDRQILALQKAPQAIKAAEGKGQEAEAAMPAGILLDAPLLFEAGLDNRCDLVMLLVADETVRIERVCQRDGVTPQEVRNRINSQMSDNEKKKKSHVIVENSGSIADLETQLENFFRKFSKNSCKRFNAVL